MEVNKKYKIKAGDEFRPGDFPIVVNELETLLQFLSELPATYKKEILLSYLRKQSLQDDWIIANPDFTSLVSSGVFATGHLESLFDACSQNKQFRQEYEHFICTSIDQVPA
jgi:hypothetical protein